VTVSGEGTQNDHLPPGTRQRRGYDAFTVRRWTRAIIASHATLLTERLHARLEKTALDTIASNPLLFTALKQLVPIIC
jgi:hypothetical protein